MSLSDGFSLPPHSYEEHLYSGLVARDSHPLVYLTLCIHTLAQLTLHHLNLFPVFRGTLNSIVALGCFSSLCVLGWPWQHNVLPVSLSRESWTRPLMAGHSSAAKWLPRAATRNVVSCYGGSSTATAGCLPPRSKRREWGKRRIITDWFAVMSVTKLPGIKGMMRQC